MNNDIKNLFEYLKEIYQLRTKVVIDYKKYDKTIDIAEFYSKYNNLTDVHLFTEELDGDDEYFILKYISKKISMPKIPAEIKEYVSIKDDELNTCATKEIPVELREKVNIFENEYKEARTINSLIEKYNNLYEYFFEINNRKEEFEEQIEVVLARGLLIYKSKNGTVIRRHIFEAPLKIDINQSSNTIYLKLDRSLKANIEYNFLTTIDFKIKDRDNLLLLKNEYEEKYLLGEKIDFNVLYKSYLNDVSLKNEFIQNLDETDIEEEKVYILKNDTIIVRKKQPTVWMEDLTTIVDKINKGEFASENTLPYLILERNDEKIEELLSSNEEKNRRVLFPLPSNDEQYTIVKQTEDSNIVLVQGPPGTGKSHTIANLISNYVSEGKRILITSEKSKALEVVKGKLPEEIRDLSIAILNASQDNNELSNSIQIVLDRYKDKEFLNEYIEEIKELETKLDNLSKMKNKNHNEIIEVLLSNVEDYKDQLSFVNLDNYRLIDIAKYLVSNKELNIIEDKNDCSEINFNNDFLFELNSIVDSLKEYKQYIIDRNCVLPSDIELDKYQRAIEDISKAGTNQVYGIDDKKIDDYDIQMLITVLEKLLKLEKLYKREYIKENCEYKPRTENIQNIIEQCKSDRAFFERTETELIGNSIEYNTLDRPLINEAINKLSEALKGDNKISLIEKMKFKKEIDIVEKIKINGKILKDNITSENVDLILKKVKYDTKVNKIKIDIVSVLSQSELWNDVNESEFSKSLNYIEDMLSTFNNYNNITKDLKYALEDIFRANEEIKNKIKDENYEEIYDKIVKLNDYSNFLKCKYDYDAKLEKLKEKTAKSHDIFAGIIDAIKEKNIEKYINEREKIENIYVADKCYTKLKEKFPIETKLYPKFISSFISMTVEDRDTIISHFVSIINYYKLEMFFELIEKNNDRLDDLLKEKDKIEEEEKIVIVKTIEKKSWYYQINNMTNVMCKALSQWLALRTKLGKGTGKRANIIRREMQEQMQIAKDAIPIWIMPIDKVIEQYPYSNKPQFDIVIMDESSQSSIMSLTALLRGKKCIIVGDDKQISPISVGITIESIKNLQTKYLKDTCLGIGFDMDTSLYDLAQSVCGSKKAVLKEHFRCLPEIINFSNIYFYGNQINCLKVRGKNNTIREPIKTYYLDDAVVSNSSSANLANKKEVEKIIEILKEIREDETYNNKTIGIIVMQNSNAQIKLINTAIWQSFDNDFIKERKIKVGNSYEFQGDERDVIILSMIISKKQEDGDTRIIKSLTTKEYERSFNVATSRGKEQMILVYSIDPGELSSECLRYKLITYCNTYNANKAKENVLQFDTDFEKDLYADLNERGIEIKPHFKVGKYEVDFAINDERGKMIGIECDGDKNSTREDFEVDVREQEVLNRCGWKFVRVRASKYYYDKEKTINEILSKLSEL